MTSLLLSALLMMALLLPASLWAQQPGLTRALDLERRGDYAAAAQAYRAQLGAQPSEPDSPTPTRPARPKRHRT